MGSVAELTVFVAQFDCVFIKLEYRVSNDRIVINLKYVAKLKAHSAWMG